MLTDGLRMRWGELADYDALAGFHYLRSRPATVTRVLVLEDERATAASRFVSGPAERRVVGVLVESMPVLGCAMRDVALRGRYSGLKGGAYLMGKLVNEDLRCISRVVVHPQWRGLGLAVRLVREALATMTPYPRWPRPADQRLRDALAWAGVEQWELASAARMRGHVERERTGLLRRELRRWAGRGRPTLDEQLEAARHELLCEPVYYLKAREG